MYVLCAYAIRGYYMQTAITAHYWPQYCSIYLAPTVHVPLGMLPAGQMLIAWAAQQTTNANLKAAPLPAKTLIAAPWQIWAKFCALVAQNVCCTVVAAKYTITYEGYCAHPLAQHLPQVPGKCRVQRTHTYPRTPAQATGRLAICSNNAGSVGGYTVPAITLGANTYPPVTYKHFGCIKLQRGC